MLALKRVRTEIAINAKYRGADKIKMDKELLLARRSVLNGTLAKIEFKSSYWTMAKSQLKKESFGKCAYCEANTAVVAHGDVEHYRPKSVYWWLAYTYDNYLFACQICNQTYKSDNFPIGGALFSEPVISATMTDVAIDNLSGKISPDPIDIDVNYTLQQYLNKHKTEKAYLINPYFDDPSVFFAYKADDVTEEVTIIPTKAKYANQVKAAEDFYGLNRLELKNFRYQTFSIFRVFKEAHKQLSDSTTKNQILKRIERMKSDKYLFAAMNRYFDTKL